MPEGSRHSAPQANDPDINEKDLLGSGRTNPLKGATQCACSFYNRFSFEAGSKVKHR